MRLAFDTALAKSGLISITCDFFMALTLIAVVVFAGLTSLSFIYRVKSRRAAEESYGKFWSRILDNPIGDASAFTSRCDPSCSGDLLDSDIKYNVVLEFETKGLSVDPMIFCFGYSKENKKYPQEIVNYQYRQSDDGSVTWEGGWSLSLDFPRVSPMVDRLAVISMLAILQDSIKPRFDHLNKLFLVVSRGDSGKIVFVYDALSIADQEDGLILLDFYRSSRGWAVKDICTPLSRKGFNSMIAELPEFR
ncbi:hypothetical protein G3480_22870 [Thiorhodococcus mannitoliphagus]|uniref:TerD family protein n=1 Tax=Thiorhodococcus mannitoliphagus TaxID=329406 RepID=A0A6P1E6B2_9GAMM|nr:hypothetical protein [Thiorhodococcus mannitoliphagus]NEX23105.1 hypothetical protein [Thiorhodococcus mannitoliphagus]